MRKLLSLAVLTMCLGRGFGQTAAPNYGSVRGIVLDSEGKPLPDAIVYALPQQDMRKQIDASTDAEGKFEINNLPPGTFYLSAYKETAGYPYNFFSFYMMPHEKVPLAVEVRSGAVSNNVTLQLGEKAAYLTIVVTTDDGSALSDGIQLVFSRPDLPGSYQRGASSRAEHIPVPPVPFRLVVEAAGFQPWHYRSEEGQPESGLISLSSGQSLALSVRLKRSR
jgi:Carboxypeptidase regulatory-like domain